MTNKQPVFLSSIPLPFLLPSHPSFLGGREHKQLLYTSIVLATRADMYWPQGQTYKLMDWSMPSRADVQSGRQRSNSYN